MNIVAFVDLVRNMRKAQKNYFKDRTQANLIASKMIEAKVDKALQEGVILRVTDNLNPKVCSLPDYDRPPGIQIAGETVEGETLPPCNTRTELDTVLSWARIYGMLNSPPDEQEIIRKAVLELEELRK
jgi:hypothetical protein